MGGATWSFLNLIRGLRTMGVESVIVCPPNVDYEFLLEIKNDKFKIYKADLVPLMINNTESSFQYYRIKRKPLIISFKELIKIIREVKPDIIHTNTGVVHEGFWCSKLFRIPHVWHLREYQDNDFNFKILPSKQLFSKMLRHSWTISITHDIQHHFKLENESKACTIYNGMLSENQICYESEKSDYFLSACRITPEKGIDDTIRAFSEFYRNYNHKYKLFILGFGSDKYIQVLKVLANDLGCASNVEFLGYKSLNTVAEYMRKAKALIVSSHFEGFGRMTAEAILSGCCVIGRNTGGTKEILEQTGGYLFSSQDELFKAMKDVTNLSSLDYEHLILDAQSKASKLFTCEQNVENTYNLYKKILHKK